MGHLGLRQCLREARVGLEQSLGHIGSEVDSLFVDMSGLIWLCLVRHVDLLGSIAVNDPEGGMMEEGNMQLRIALASFLDEVGVAVGKGSKRRS